MALVARAVGKASEFREMEPKVVDVDGKTIGVVLLGGRYYAYRNKCPHQGGPACEGDVRASVSGVVEEGGRYREQVSKTDFSMVCPWHGVEYDVKTGACRTDARVKLRQYKVVVEGDTVKIEV